MRSNLIFINQIEVQLPSRVRKPNLCKNPNFSLRQPLYAVRRRYRRSPSRFETRWLPPSKKTKRL
ncbi:hypothetical protein Lalb_Chr16g0389831 [Lupinus albus]|uniref:Uncharacterized protein n=1 Tax=Lupinus albus TaxID=3870 RepID=A0A6A4P7D9_LUPAL|nr:hypothetical protein Lalb_Chr16g0389831 [Lupinus albus]